MQITRSWILVSCCLIKAILPIRGTASDVVGIIDETRFMKTVRDRRTVTSAKARYKQGTK